jgi:glycolate oxidase iron-sulfur subunit
MVRDYGAVFAGDPLYADKARRIAALLRDPAEIVSGAWSFRDEQIDAIGVRRTLAFHPPCSLQHGLAIRGVVEPLLEALGFTLVPVTDAHLCCGSAGTYSILQPELADALRARKLQALTETRPDVIATANIGCITHLQSGTETPIRHWIELVDAAMSESAVRASERRS